MKTKKNKEEKHPKCIEEPKPGANHVICAICREQFKDYMEHIFSNKHSKGVINNNSIFSEIDIVINEITEFQANKKKISEQKILNVEKKPIVRLRTINNPESMTTGTEDLSSGASNRSKTTMGTDSDYLQQPCVNIQIECETKKRVLKAEQKKGLHEPAPPIVSRMGLDIIEIRDSSAEDKRKSSRKSRTSEEESRKKQRVK